MQSRLVIFGCGGHGKAVLDVVLHNGDFSDIVFVDHNAKDSEDILGFPILKEYSVNDEKVFIAVGDNAKRTALCEKYYENLTSVVSNNAYIGRNVKIGKGVFIGHHAHVGILSVVEDFVIVNTSASADHECRLKRGCFIAPNSTLCGKVTVGELSFVGAGSVVKEKIQIGTKVIVGGGAVVVKNLEQEGIYFGIPAKKNGIKLFE